MSTLDSDAPVWKTTLNTVANFAQLSNFLQKSAADEETAKLSASMGELSQAVEAVGAQLKLKRGAPQALGPLLVSLLTALRKHRSTVVALSPSWRGLYEYAAYLAALNNFRVLVGQWVLERNLAGGAGEEAASLDDFEMIGWRTLGEGMIMMDMHEQARAAAQSPTDIIPIDERLSQAKSWWHKLRT
jgi:hypothetical protein